MDYWTIKRQAAAYSETNDCAVKAIAIVTGYTYSETWIAMKRLGRKPRHPTPNIISFRLLEERGCQWEDVKPYYPAKTTRTLERILPREGRFLIWTGGYSQSHLAAYVDGCVEDWSYGKMTRVLRVTEVVRPGACNQSS